MAKNTIVPALATLLAAVVLAGCTAENHGAGGNGASASAASVATAPPSVFALVPDAPPGFGDLNGTADLVDSPDGGSDVSITLHGLKANVRYLSHLHAGTCDQPDPGGPHFKFDLDGPDTPPNEIHLAFTANATRNASAEAHSSRRVPNGAARSIVVHQDAPMGGSSPAAAKPQAAAGQAQHAGHSSGATSAANAAGGHSHAAKIACATLRQPAQSNGERSTRSAPTGQSDNGNALAINVADNEPVDGVRELTVRKGARVRFTVTSDKPEQVHVHAYDLIEDVGPTTQARLDFPADIEGIFDVELEHAGVPILSLTVNP